MEPISCAVLFELFIDTLDHFGTFLLNEDTESIERYVFEEFDDGCISFLHDNALNRLMDGGCISAEVYPLCQRLHKNFRALDGTALWNTEAVRTTSEWYELLSLADKIRKLVEN